MTDYSVLVLEEIVDGDIVNLKLKINKSAWDKLKKREAETMQRMVIVVV